MTSSIHGLPESVTRRISPEAVPFRQTFLRNHIPAKLGDIREVLAVKALVDGAGRDVPIEDRFWLLDQYFDTDLPQERTWLPVRLKAGGVLPASTRTSSLTDLLVDLKSKSNAAVLLAAGTGAGKTLAAFKAFRDCFLPVSETQRVPNEPERTVFVPPPLAGYSPLWLPVHAAVPARDLIEDRDDIIRKHAPRLLRELMVAAGLPDDNQMEAGKRWTLVDQWITHGPPLLLFVDLNLADDLTRRCLAEALGRWQHDFGANKKHRVVVTYRSALDDSVLNTLRGLTPLCECDLEPIDAEQAKHYLLGYRSLERRFYSKCFNKSAAARKLAPEAEADLLGKLVEAHGRDRASLISTPLLMHFATTLREGLSEVQTIADLYDRLVVESLERDLRHKGEDVKRVWQRPLNPWQEGARLIKVVMTRVALAILAKSPNDTRLSARDTGMSIDDLFASLVQTPDQPIAGMEWQHPDAFWRKGPYQSKEIRRSTDFDENRFLNDEILEVGLFRRDNDSLGFAHDSLVYYFAGKVALRDYLGPGQPARRANLGDLWPKKVAERVRDNPPAWERAGQFLGASLTTTELLGLAQQMLAVGPKLETSGVGAVLYSVLRGRPGRDPTLAARPLEDEVSPNEAILRDLERLTWRAEGRRYPAALAAMALHWLRDARPTAERQGFGISLEHCLIRAGRPWLRADPTVPRTTAVYHRSHRSVSCLAILPGGWVVSGGKEGKLVAWHPESGITRLLNHDLAGVDCAVAIEGNGIASWSHGGAVVVWQLGNEIAREVYRQARASSLGGLPIARLPQGGFAAGDEDGVVAVWKPGDNVASEIYHHSATQKRLTAWANGAIASLDNSGFFAYWNSLNDIKMVMDSDECLVTDMAHLTNDWLALALTDGTVGLWRPGDEDIGVVHLHEGGVWSLTALVGGGLASFGKDGALAVWQPGDEPADVVWRRDVMATELAALPDGGVAVGCRDGVVAVWRTGNPEATEVHKCRGAVECMAVLLDGGLAIGDSRGTVAIWRPGECEVTEVQRREAEVTCLAPLIDVAGLVIGNDDGLVSLWRPGDAANIEVHRYWVGGPSFWDLLSGVSAETVSASLEMVHLQGTGAEAGFTAQKEKVQAIASLPGGGVASADDVGVVAVWRPDHESPVVVRRSECPITNLLGLSGGGVASADMTGAVAVWRPGDKGAREIYHHPNAFPQIVPLDGGGLAVAGLTDDAIAVWAPGDEPAKVVHLPIGGTFHLVPSGAGDLAIGCDNGVVAFWAAGDKNPRVVHRHEGKVANIQSLDNGGIASAGDDGSVVVWWPGDKGAKEVQRHTAEVCSLLALPGGALASGGTDGVVAVWRPGQEAATVVCRDEASHSPVVKCANGSREWRTPWITHLDALDGGGVASGDSWGVVRYWLPGDEVAKEVYRHARRVASLVGLVGGGLASAGGDGVVALCRAGNEAAAPLYQQRAPDIFGFRLQNRNFPLLPLSDGGFVSLGVDGVMVAWRPGAAAVVVHRHDSMPTALTSLHGAGVASGSEDGSLAVWLPGWPYAASLVTFESVEELLWLPTWDQLGGRLAVRLARGPMLLVQLCGLDGGEVGGRGKRQ